MVSHSFKLSIMYWSDLVKIPFHLKKIEQIHTMRLMCRRGQREHRKTTKFQKLVALYSVPSETLVFICFKDSKKVVVNSFELVKQEPQGMRLEISLQKLKMARNKKRKWMYWKTINITFFQTLCRSVKINWKGIEWTASEICKNVSWIGEINDRC